MSQIINNIKWSFNEKCHATLEHRLFDVYEGPFPAPEGTRKEDFVKQRKSSFLPLVEGDCFELGGVNVSLEHLN